MPFLLCVRCSDGEMSLTRLDAAVPAMSAAAPIELSFCLLLVCYIPLAILQPPAVPVPADKVNPGHLLPLVHARFLGGTVCSLSEPVCYSSETPSARIIRAAKAAEPPRRPVSPRSRVARAHRARTDYILNSAAVILPSCARRRWRQLVALCGRWERRPPASSPSLSTGAVPGRVTTPAGDRHARPTERKAPTTRCAPRARATSSSCRPGSGS